MTPPFPLLLVAAAAGERLRLSCLVPLFHLQDIEQQGVAGRGGGLPTIAALPSHKNHVNEKDAVVASAPSRKVWSASPSLRTPSGCWKTRLPTTSPSFTDLRERESRGRAGLGRRWLVQIRPCSARRAGEDFLAPLSAVGLSNEAGGTTTTSSLREPQD